MRNRWLAALERLFGRTAMTEEQARSALLAVGVPPRVLESWADRSSLLATLSWARPDFAMADSLQRAVPGLAGLCPLFEQNGEAVIGVLPGSGAFVRLYYEDGEDGDAAIETLGRNYQQFAFFVIMQFEESGGAEDYPALVEILGLQRAGELRRLLDASPYDDAAV